MLLSSLAASIYARITFVLGLCAWGIPPAVGFSQMTSCRLQLIIAPWCHWLLQKVCRLQPASTASFTPRHYSFRSMVSVRRYCTSVTLGVASSVANGVIMRTGAASAVENDIMMIIPGIWRYGDWRHVATGCNALV